MFSRDPVPMAVPNPVIQTLLLAADEAFDRKSWHGPNLKGSIRGLNADRAAWRPSPGRHNIHEIVIHCAYWKYVARRRLLGEKRETFSRDGSDWFPVMSPNAAEWKRDVALLVEMHRALRSAIALYSPRAVHRAVPGSELRAISLINGATAHDLYHAGQIQLLKRLGARSATTALRRAHSAARLSAPAGRR